MGKNLNVSVQFTQNHIVEDEEVTVEECIENRKWLPLPMITVKYTLNNCFKEKGRTEKNKKMSDNYNRNEIFFNPHVSENKKKDRFHMHKTRYI